MEGGDYVCQSTLLEVQGKYEGVDSLLPCRFWELKSGHQFYQYVPLPNRSSY